MELNFEKVQSELKTWMGDHIRQNSSGLSEIINSVIAQGSRPHRLTKAYLTVYINSPGDYDGKETVDVTKFKEHTVANTWQGLMASGTKFFDAYFYLTLAPEDRPDPLSHPEDKIKSTTPNFATYNDHSKLCKFFSAYYSFLVIRAHPPTSSGLFAKQPMPEFISTVLGVKEGITEIADYLADFDLEKIDPRWAKYIDLPHLSQEQLIRLGLEVAGYRYVSIFNVFPVDKYDSEEQEKKPVRLDEAVKVARSFRNAGFCWDFHPLTRRPNVLSKYGNVNKNASNLILEAYSTAAIEKMVKCKKLSQIPIYDPAYTDYKGWNSSLIYKATSPMFPHKA